MQDLISYYPALALGFCLLFALTVGSFLNVVIHRLPIMLARQWKQDCQQYLELPQTGDETLAPYNLMVPRSRCPHCDSPIHAWQNIPLISWLLLKGRCANCAAPIKVRYPLVELSAALLCYFAWLAFGFSSAFIAASLFCWLLLCLALIDLDTMLLPDQLTLPGLWLGLLLNTQAMFVSLPSAVIGAAIGYLSLWSLYWCFKLLTGKEGMGYGDFKLLAMIGAWFGWQALPLTILLSSALGAVVGLAMLALKRQQQDQAVPFGPYLVLGALAYLFVGESVQNWYWAWAGL